MVIDIKKEIEKYKRDGMPDFMIEEHIMDLIAEEEEEDDEEDDEVIPKR